ncbi:hypothetical protein CHS0354_019364 [Potamilus streckersoni]|uniref:Uncharacterized protein n=1 Tax=Potamilus streckersoni TaxID=2493646 RepID=A0AAE0SI08_9BIVA|nr:hypothetical protein CHS0354_019364 [Potamilus streckersoni]
METKCTSQTNNREDSNIHSTKKLGKINNMRKEWKESNSVKKEANRQIRIQDNLRRIEETVRRADNRNKSQQQEQQQSQNYKHQIQAQELEIITADDSNRSTTLTTGQQQQQQQSQKCNQETQVEESKTIKSTTTYLHYRV